MGDKLLINGVVFQGRTDILSWDSIPLISGFNSTLITAYVTRTDNQNYPVWARPSRQNVSFVSVADYLPNFSYPHPLEASYGGSESCGEPTPSLAKPTDGNRWTIMTFESSTGLFGVATSGVFVADTWIRVSTSNIVITPCSISEGCELIINYSDGKNSKMEYPECPTVSELNDALCPSACDLATQILSKLGG